MAFHTTENIGDGDGDGVMGMEGVMALEKRVVGDGDGDGVMAMGMGMDGVMPLEKRIVVDGDGDGDGDDVCDSYGDGDCHTRNMLTTFADDQIFLWGNHYIQHCLHHWQQRICP